MTLPQALLKRGIRLRVTSEWKVHLNCPFCVERGKPVDTKQRLCIHTRERWGKCVHCGWKSRNAAFPVLRQLGILDHVEGFDREESKGETPPPELPSDFSVLTRVYDDLDKQARDYLLKRGVTHSQIAECKIGVSYSGRFAYRILFPVWKGSELRGINARSFTDTAGPKYLLNAGEKYLFHFDPDRATTVLSEGCFKALRIARVTEWGSAALLGHDLTDKQLEQIKSSKCERIVLYPDIDDVGRRGFLHVADKLAENWSGEVLFVWPVKLPADDAPLEDLRELLTNPLSYSLEVRRSVLQARKQSV